MANRQNAGVQPVIAGLVAVIHAYLWPRPGQVAGRNKSGHDGFRKNEYYVRPAHL